MKQKKSVDRHAVPENKLERFMGLVYSLAEPFGVTELPEVYHYVELLGQAIERQIVEASFVGSPKNRKVADRKKFISIFKARYLHLTDLEYPRAITGVDATLMSQVSKMLDDNGLLIDDFLKWLFESFLTENEKFCPPTIKLSCSGFIIEKFLYENKDKIKKRKEEQLEQKSILDLIGRARVLIREFADDEENKENVKKVLINYREGCIILGAFRNEIEVLEKLLRDKKLQQETK